MVHKKYWKRTSLHYKVTSYQASKMIESGTYKSEKGMYENYTLHKMNTHIIYTDLF